jgi:hypothetical protein
MRKLTGYGRVSDDHEVGIPRNDEGTSHQTNELEAIVSTHPRICPAIVASERFVLGEAQRGRRPEEW